MVPSRVIAIRMASSLSASFMAIGLSVLASSAIGAFCNIGVTTMKMMSNTSITSTMGVTLISELTLLPSSRFAIPIIPVPRGQRRRNDAGPASAGPSFRELDRLSSGRSPLRPLLLLSGSAAALQEVINQFAGAVIHLHIERLHLIGEVIEHPHRRDGHKQADGRGDQRFGTTASHCRQTRRLLVGDADERVQNARHRAQQSPERGGRAKGPH